MRWQKRKYSEHSPTICRQFSEKIFFKKLNQNPFPKVFVDFQIFRKWSENSLRIFRKIIAQEFYQRHFPEFYNFRKFSENFETILVDVRFQFCLAAEFIWQDGAILPMISQSNCEKAGQDEKHLITYNNNIWIQ